MVNVYDWYESFGLVLENQKRHQRQAHKDPENKSEASGGEGSDMEQNSVVEDDDDDDEEAWKMHVQARFIKALHELDYVGLIKHTGRKADHVMRTVFEVLE